MHSGRVLFLCCHSLCNMLADMMHLLIFNDYGVIPTTWNSYFLVTIRLFDNLHLSSVLDVLGYLLCTSFFQWFFSCAWICGAARIGIGPSFAIHSVKCFQSSVTGFPTQCHALWFWWYISPHTVLFGTQNTPTGRKTRRILLPYVKGMHVETKHREVFSPVPERLNLLIYILHSGCTSCVSADSLNRNMLSFRW